MKRVLKFLKWTGISLGALLVLFIGINAFDETLDPGAAAILNAPPKVRPEDNAYFYLAGMYTTTTNNPSEAGKHCVAAQMKIAQAGTLLSDQKSLPECREIDALQSVKENAISCDVRQKPCLKQYFEQTAEIEHLAAQNQIVLERYERLLEFKKFEDTYSLHPLLVFIKFPPSKLYQAISAARLQSGDSSAFIRRTVAETEFYRVILRGESSVLYRMIAIAWLERTARLVSEAVQADVILAQQNQVGLLQITRPLGLPERDFGRAMEGEFRYTNSMLRSFHPIVQHSWSAGFTGR